MKIVEQRGTQNDTTIVYQFCSITYSSTFGMPKGEYIVESALCILGYPHEGYKEQNPSTPIAASDKWKGILEPQLERYGV